MPAAIIFPYLGITIGDFPNSFELFGINIAFYGVLIAIGMVLGVLTAILRAKKTGQKVDDYIDISIAAIVAGIIGARIYYVLFKLDYYAAHPSEIFDIRQGGLAIYGGLILGILAAWVVVRIKKLSFLKIADTCVPGIALAQFFGRWGNFFNREAFGEYTDSLFAMQIKLSDVTGVVTDSMRENIVMVNGTEYIQVHPTFLYESFSCLLLFILLILFRKFQQYDGEVLLWYAGGYGLERMLVEGLRSDSLMIGSSGIRVSQLLSVLIFTVSLIILVWNRIKIYKKTSYPAGLDHNRNYSG